MTNCGLLPPGLIQIPLTAMCWNMLSYWVWIYAKNPPWQFLQAHVFGRGERLWVWPAGKLEGNQAKFEFLLHFTCFFTLHIIKNLCWQHGGPSPWRAQEQMSSSFQSSSSLNLTLVFSESPHLIRYPHQIPYQNGCLLDVCACLSLPCCCLSAETNSRLERLFSLPSISWRLVSITVLLALWSQSAASLCTVIVGVSDRH